MPTSVARLTDTGSHVSFTAAVRPAATTSVAPRCPTANATTSRALPHINSATASRQTSPGSHT